MFECVDYCGSSKSSMKTYVPSSSSALPTKSARADWYGDRPDRTKTKRQNARSVWLRVQSCATLNSNDNFIEPWRAQISFEMIQTNGERWSLPVDRFCDRLSGFKVPSVEMHRSSTNIGAIALNCSILEKLYTKERISRQNHQSGYEAMYLKEHVASMRTVEECPLLRRKRVRPLRKIFTSRSPFVPIITRPSVRRMTRKETGRESLCVVVVVWRDCS